MPKLAPHFGLFLKRRVFDHHGGPTSFSEKYGFDVSTFRRWARARTSEEARVHDRYQHRLATALGFDNWEAFILAADTTPMPVPVKETGAPASPETRRQFVADMLVMAEKLQAAIRRAVAADSTLDAAILEDVKRLDSEIAALRADQGDPRPLAPRNDIVPTGLTQIVKEIGATETAKEDQQPRPPRRRKK